MALKRLINLLFIILITLSLFSQTRFAGKITGTIRDAQSSEPLPYTNIFLADRKSVV